MPRPRIRHGQKEVKNFKKLVSSIVNFKFYENNKDTKRETAFTDKLRTVLEQPFIDVTSQKFDTVKIVGETYRPDLVIGKTAIEVKFLRENGHKSKFKEGLAQALVYSSKYKFVALVLVDLTKKSLYYRADSRSDRAYGELKRKLGDHRIKVVPIRPQLLHGRQ